MHLTTCGMWTGCQGRTILHLFTGLTGGWLRSTRSYQLHQAYRVRVNKVHCDAMCYGDARMPRGECIVLIDYLEAQMLRTHAKYIQALC